MLRDALGPAPAPARLEQGLRLALRYHAVWVGTPRHDPETGLARYRDDGQGPAPEVLADEIDAQGRDHYDRVAMRLAAERDAGRDVARFLDAAGRLTALAYLGDRSMRESGFDASDRFGPLSLDIVRFAPVCLNTLLVVYERDLAWMMARLGDAGGAARFRAAAEARAAALVARTWDEPSGLFLDWHLEEETRRDYPFLTTFWPLWAGLASSAQAARVRDQLPLFERPGGLMASPSRTGCQWDAPFAWAPLQLFAVGGLHRYGFEADARRVAAAFLRAVQADFEATGVFREKYDAEAASGDVTGQLAYGYASNEVGFGWTNAVVLELLDYLETGDIEVP
jgi:alpha,alpha-trehalase